MCSEFAGVYIDCVIHLGDKYAVATISARLLGVLAPIVGLVYQTLIELAQSLWSLPNQ